jgi:hypothetical protein
MRPTLLECGMPCSRFHGISFETVTFQDGGSPGPMGPNALGRVPSVAHDQFADSARLSDCGGSARLTSPVVAQPEPQGPADFEIVAGSNLAPLAVDFEDLAPIQQLPASPTLSQQGLVESSHQNRGVHDHHH